MNQPRYVTIAADIQKSIEVGVLTPGERLPSIRRMAEARHVSVTTIKRAYLLCEARSLIEARPQSGYFVRATRPTAEASFRLRVTAPDERALPVDVAGTMLTMLHAIQTRQALPLGLPYPDPKLLPWRRIIQHSQAIARRFESWSAIDDIPPGHQELLRQIARRHLQTGLNVSPEDIVVTIGATEAINLSLQAVAKPGDAIAVESPCYCSMLQAIERCGMRAIEIPTHPEEGINLAALEGAIRRQRVAACLTMPNFQNPLGFEMADDKKKAFVDLATRHNMPLIENAVYNEFHYGDTPPTTLKEHDRKGIVLFCGSFSKSLTAGMRIGWAIPGRYRQMVEKLKFLNTLATSALPQLAIAEYLGRDGWDHQLRGVRRTLSQRCDIMRAAVSRFFPAGTRLSSPRGGYLLWIELPEHVDSRRLFLEALRSNITVAPGANFSNSNLYRNFIRLNFSYPWTSELDSAIRTLGAIAGSMRSDMQTRPLRPGTAQDTSDAPRD